MKQRCVWVMEIGVLHATLPKVSHWEIWQAFNTRREAVAERDRPSRFKMPRRLRNATQRIVKYVPAMQAGPRGATDER